MMMNEFSPKYIEVVREGSNTAMWLLKPSNYLNHLFAMGVRDADLPPVQAPMFQPRIWDRFKPGYGAEKLANVIEQLNREDSRFNMEGGSRTNNISQVRGYERLLAPMEELSSLFYEKALKLGMPTSELRYHGSAATAVWRATSNAMPPPSLRSSASPCAIRSGR